MRCFIFIRLPLVTLSIGLVVLSVWLALPDTERTSEGEAIAEVADEGILSALDEEGVPLPDKHEDVTADLTKAVTDSVADAAEVVTEESDAPLVVEEELAEVAPGPALDAVVNIVRESENRVEELIRALPETARPPDVSGTAEKIVENTLRDLDLEPGTLDEKDEVSTEVAESLTAGEAGDTIKMLNLTPGQEAQLEEAVTEEVTSSIVRSSADATDAIADDLTKLIKQTLRKEATRWFADVDDLGATGYLAVLLINAVGIALRQCPVKLRRLSHTRLKYATASHCTIEGIRLEMPLFFFLNWVREIDVPGKSLPFTINPQDGELTVAVGSRRCLRPSWNLRLLWSLVARGSCGKYFYAIYVNGRWCSSQREACD